MNSTDYPKDLDSLRNSIISYLGDGYHLSEINRIEDKGNIVEIDAIFNNAKTEIIYSKEKKAITNVTYFILDTIPVGFWVSKFGHFNVDYLESLINKTPEIIPKVKELAENGFRGEKDTIPDGPRFAEFVYWVVAYKRAYKKIRNKKELEKSFKDKYRRYGNIKILEVSVMADEDRHEIHYRVIINGMTGLLNWNIYRDVLDRGYILIGDTKINLNLYNGYGGEVIERVYFLLKDNKLTRDSFKDEYIQDVKGLERLFKSLNL